MSSRLQLHDEPVTKKKLGVGAKQKQEGDVAAAKEKVELEDEK